MRSGGRYEKRDGKPVLTGRTKDHPDGNRPRDTGGHPINRPEPALQKTPAKPKSEKGA